MPRQAARVWFHASRHAWLNGRLSTRKDLSVADRRVFFHIGAPKTGTTYLQNLLSASRERLLQHGILYATGKYSRDRVWATEVLRGLDHSRHPRPQASGAWDRIVGQVRGWDRTSVISHEFFGACSAEQARRALTELQPAEVHLVFTARDYLSQAGAVWQERLKYGHATRFRDFRLDAAAGTPVWSWRTQDILGILGRWQHDLPASRVHVVTVPRGGKPSVLWERFASVIGVDPAVASADIGSANQSLGVVEAELLRRVDERVGSVLRGSREHARWTRDLLANRVLSRGSRERFAFSGEYAVELEALSREAVAGITTAGYDVVGDLDDLLPPHPLPTTRSPDDASTEELLDAAVDAIVGLIATAKDTEARHRAQLEQLRRSAATPRHLYRRWRGRAPAEGAAASRQSSDLGPGTSVWSAARDLVRGARRRTG